MSTAAKANDVTAPLVVCPSVRVTNKIFPFCTPMRMDRNVNLAKIDLATTEGHTYHIRRDFRKYGCCVLVHDMDPMPMEKGTP